MMLRRGQTKRIPEIKPGWFLAGDLHVDGCMHYNQTERSQQEFGDKGEANWKGHARCDSVAENKKVYTWRARATAALNDVCTKTRLGWFCPYEKDRMLAFAIKELNRIIAEYNADAKYTRLWHDIVPMEIGASGALAARIIWTEAKEQLVDLQNALKKADLDQIRKVATNIQRFHDILPGRHESDLYGIVTSVRNVARTLKRDAEKLDHDAKVEILREVYAPVEIKRMQFAEALERCDDDPGLPTQLREVEPNETHEGDER